MKKTKKIAALLLAAVMLVTATVAVTIAYLQSQTEVVTNTMTVGKVVITLDEAPVDTDGQEDTTASGRVTENNYKLYPGKEYDKDPTVWVDEDSEDCYVFVKVVNEIEAIESEDAPTIAEQMAAKGWVQLVDKEGNDVENVYYYNGDQATDSIVSAGAKLVVFENFTIDKDVDNTTLFGDGTNSYPGYAGETVKIEAFAVQEEGFADVNAAWDAVEVTWNI